MVERPYYLHNQEQDDEPEATPRRHKPVATCWRPPPELPPLRSGQPVSRRLPAVRRQEPRRRQRPSRRRLPSPSRHTAPPIPHKYVREGGGAGGKRVRRYASPQPTPRSSQENGQAAILCPRQDSNLRFYLRRVALYPLSYGGRDGPAASLNQAGRPCRMLPAARSAAAAGWHRARAATAPSARSRRSGR
jgi:hypothetical protein